MSSSDFSSIEINESGSGNAITGLTATGSGNSLTSLTMPATGFAYTGRTIISSGADDNEIRIPA
jgi:hypothetical protein